MHFTQEDYIKIENWLHRNSVKDTEFQEALPFTGKEIVTVVQDGHNRKVNIQEFINQLYKHGVEDFLNVTNTYKANNITLKEAIRLIPAEARKEGQVITFLNTDGNWEIYQFIGKLNQWNNPTLWNNPFDWEKFVVDSILPDEEDLTKSVPDAKGNSYLSLKDRKYEPDKYSGLGRKILRRRVVEIEDPIYGTQEKNLLLQADFAEDNTVYVVRYDFTLNGQDITLPDNSYIEYEGGSISDGNIIDRAGGLNRVVLKKNIINGKNILTQSMINKENTIYEIRYDFDLNDAEITIPENCVLDFQGGSLGNGTVVGNNTKINYNYSVFNNISIKGVWLNQYVKSSIFKNIHDNNVIKNLIPLCADGGTIHIEHSEFPYNVSADNLDDSIISLKNNIKLIIDGHIKLAPNSFKKYKIISVENLSNVIIEGNGAIEGDREYHDFSEESTHEWGYGLKITNSYNVIVRGITIFNCTGDAIGLSGENIEINKVRLHHCRRQGISIFTSKNIRIENFEIHDIEGTLPMDGIDIEPDNGEASYIYIKNGNIYNCRIGLEVNINERSSASYLFINNVTISNIYSGFRLANIENVFIDNVQVTSVLNSTEAGGFYLLGIKNAYINNSYVNTYIDDSNNSAQCLYARNTTRFKLENVIIRNSIFKSKDVSCIVGYNLTFRNCKLHCNNHYAIYASKSYVGDDYYNNFFDCEIIGRVLVSVDNSLWDNCTFIKNSESNVHSYIVTFSDITKETIFKNCKFFNEDEECTSAVSVGSEIVSLYDCYFGGKFKYGIYCLKTATIRALGNKAEDSINIVYRPAGSNNIITDISTSKLLPTKASWHDKGLTVFDTTLNKPVFCNITVNNELLSTIVNKGYAFLNNSLSKGVRYILKSPTKSNYMLRAAFAKNMIEDYNNEELIYIQKNTSTEVEFIAPDPQEYPYIMFHYEEANHLVQIYDLKIIWLDSNGFTAKQTIGDTSQRPLELNESDYGFQYFDTTLNKPIWWTGSKWVDATGTDV